MAVVSKRVWCHHGVRKQAFRVRYVDSQGAERQKSFGTKKEADAFRDRLVTELASDKHLSEGVAVSLSEAAEQYLSYQDQRVREKRIQRTSAQNIRISVRVHLLPVLGSKMFNDVKVLDVERWHGVLLKRLSPGTAKFVLGRVAAMERYAAKREMTRCTAFREYCSEVKGIENQPIRTFTLEEIQCLLRIVDTHEPHTLPYVEHRTRCFVHVAAFCGLRYGEIAGLSLSHVDLDGRVLRVRQSITQHGDIKGPKTKAGVRDVPMPVHVANLLTTWIERYYVPNRNELLFLTLGGQKGPRKFRGLSRKPYPNAYFHDSWRRLLKRAGLSHEKDHFHFHALRHFAASWMVQSGIPLLEVPGLLGHAKFDMTMRVYAHPIVRGNHHHDTVDRFATAMLGAPTITLQAEPGAPVAEVRKNSRRPTEGACTVVDNDTAAVIGITEPPATAHAAE